jgi:RTX calcium-binding nonapeptide repeat (4 copies)
MSRALVAGIIVALGVTSPAAASTVTFRVDPRNSNFAGIVYRASAGEANRLTLTFSERYTTIRVVDTGATITASGPQCRSLDANTAECTATGVPGVIQLLGANVALGDLDDVVVSEGPGLTANGGPGDDSLRGTSGIAGTLNGGGGRDTLVGGSNSDTLIDGDAGGAADADVLDGRGDADTVSYATRTARVRVDLADPAPDGERGENDVLRSVERVRGGQAGDVIGGGRGFNVLDGRGGDDRIFGRAGQDFISGGPGSDELTGGDGADNLTGDSGPDHFEGGAGNDILFAARAGPDSVNCGPGRGDVVVAPNRRDITDPDCEEAVFGFSDGRSIELAPHPVRRGGGSVTFELRCPSSEELDGLTLPIAGSIALRRSTGRQVQLGRGDIPKGPGRRCGRELDTPRRVRVRVELNALGRRLLAAQGGARVIVSLRGHNVPHRRWTIDTSVRG